MAKRTPLATSGRVYPIESTRREPEYRMPADFDYTSAGVPCSDKFDKLKRGQCMVQLTFDQGMPALRFCNDKNKPGHLVHVDSPAEAAEAARLGCECFEKTGSYDACLPEGLKLGAVKPRRRRRSPAAPAASSGKYCVVRGGRKLSCHTTRAAADRAAKAARDRCKKAKGAARCKGRTTVKKSR